MPETSRMWTETEIEAIADQAIVEALGDVDDQKLWSEAELDNYIKSNRNDWADNLPWVAFWLGLFGCIAFALYLANDYESQPAVICIKASQGVFGNKELGVKCFEALQKK